MPESRFLRSASGPTRRARRGLPGGRVEGTSVFLSDEQLRILQKRASDVRQQAIDAADHCDEVGKHYAADRPPGSRSSSAARSP